MMIYPQTEIASFFRTRDPLGELSNMKNGMPLVHNGIVYSSSEALYQLLRYPGMPDIQAEINSAPNAFVSKQVAYKYKHLTRPDWQEVKVSIMEEVVRLKTAQHWAVIAAALDSTAGKDIVERSSKDAFWGAISDGQGNLVGQNVLGILWMIIREEINQQNFHKEVNFIF